MSNKVCGQCFHFLAGHCWLNPPVPTASGHMMRPRVEVDTAACGQFRHAVQPSSGAAATARSAKDVPMPSAAEAARIAADWEAQGKLVVDRTPGPAGAPKGKRKAVEA
jgi:hypothetical protein